MRGALILLADSQLLFARARTAAFRAQLRAQLRAAVAAKQGVYIGASNGDETAYYELAHAALTAMGATLAWQRAGEPALSPHYDFYLLAGGDVAQGWRYLSQPPVRAALEQAHDQGALMIGVSAGAMHLASALADDRPVCERFLGFHDAAVAVHEEHAHWPTHQRWMRMNDERPALLGIPMGSAVVCTPSGDFGEGQGVRWWCRDGSERALPPLPPDSLSKLNPQDGRFNLPLSGTTHND